ncbi:uncharacterized protein LOC143037935 [Oratosquilla oratoria]|uniref:uncharacterized protein LOC143037935 n=1 Tax=Oratosquilla oratoria TaxID=337810 RepID=UPI003F772327
MAVVRRIGAARSSRLIDLLPSKLLLQLSVFYLALVKASSIDIVTYDFKEFPYKESVVNEKTWAEYESACSQSPRCLTLHGIEHTRCVRECVSPSCYIDIYQHDELEEGEIDVRLSSFKGCFIQRLNRKRP